METQSYDVIVLGAGPAGLTAALYLARARRPVLVLDTGTAGGQMNLTHEIANYPGVFPAVSGAQLGRIMRTQAEAFGAQVITQADIERMDLMANPKVFEVADEGVMSAKAVIIAVGGTPRTLGIPGEARFKGRGVSYCATCDGDFFTGKKIAVIGGGNSALEEAVSLTRYASNVTILHEFDHFQAHAWAVEQARANPKIQFVMEQTILSFEGEEKITAVISQHKRTGEVIQTPVDGVFIFIGYVPNTTNIPVAKNERGEILVDDMLRTHIPGVFAAGDAREKRFRQITTAVADGTIAALTATDFLDNR